MDYSRLLVAQKACSEGVEIVSKVGDDIRIHFEDSGFRRGIIQNGFWKDGRRHGI